MLDIQFIRDNQDVVSQAIVNKGSDADLAKLLQLDDKRRGLISKADEIRSSRNNLAASTKNTKPSQQQINEGRDLKAKLAEIENELRPVNQEYEAELYKVPNIPSSDTPVGRSEDQNIVLKTWGEKTKFDFEPKAHWDMPHFFDEPRATRISGARFTFFRGGIVRLQLAMIMYGMDVLTDGSKLRDIAEQAGLDVSTKPFVPMLPPTMMRTDAYKATGRLKPDEVTYKLANDDLWLTGSSEHTMCAYHIGETLDASDLPMRYVGYNTAYRREVGSAGQDTRGAIRQHQFDKLEMESFTLPEDGRKEHEFMIAIQEYLMQQLGIPYQLIHKCTFDMGGPNIRGVDVEAWMPGQGKYRETHTADFIGDYQTRGLGTKGRLDDGSSVLLHTNDATVFSQRPLIALIENNQTQDGRVKVPEVLRPYLGGQEFIGGDK